MKKWKRAAYLLLALALALGLSGCSVLDNVFPIDEGVTEGTEWQGGLDEGSGSGQNGGQSDELPEKGTYYYDLENVVLYLNTYGDLPDNFITKGEARKLGWEGDSVEPFKEGGAIGGDTFGNREGLLPKEKGRTYKECDLNTLGQKKRGAERLVYSSDGLYFHTVDHYESFTQVYVENGRVVK